VLNGYDIVAKEIYDRYRNIGWSIRSLINLYTRKSINLLLIFSWRDYCHSLSSDQCWQSTSSAVSPECRCSTHQCGSRHMNTLQRHFVTTYTGCLSVSKQHTSCVPLFISVCTGQLHLSWQKCVFPVRLLPALVVVVFVQQHVEIWWCPERER